MKYIGTLIVVEDIPRARKFYEEILAQKILFDFGANVSFESGLSLHRKDHFAHLLHDKKIQTGAHDAELYFDEDRIDAFAQKIKEMGIPLVHDLEEQEWGQKVIRFYDPDLHIIEVGESMEQVCIRLHKSGWEIQDICRKTTMPEAFIQNAIKTLNFDGTT